jgi:hypothetical protein
MNSIIETQNMRKLRLQKRKIKKEKVFQKHKHIFENIKLLEDAFETINKMFILSKENINSRDNNIRKKSQQYIKMYYKYNNNNLYNKIRFEYRKLHQKIIHKRISHHAKFNTYTISMKTLLGLVDININNRIACIVCQIMPEDWDKFRRCGQCDLPSYCSQKCQILDWDINNHKKICKKVKIWKYTIIK